MEPIHFILNVVSLVVAKEVAFQCQALVTPIFDLQLKALLTLLIWPEDILFEIYKVLLEFPILQTQTLYLSSLLVHLLLACSQRLFLVLHLPFDVFLVFKEAIERLKL